MLPGGGFEAPARGAIVVDLAAFRRTEVQERDHKSWANRYGEAEVHAAVLLAVSRLRRRTSMIDYDPDERTGDGPALIVASSWKPFNVGGPSR